MLRQVDFLIVRKHLHLCELHSIASIHKMRRYEKEFTTVCVFLLMKLIALGVNHNTAPVNIREKVAFAPAEIEPALSELSRQFHLQEIAILSTCNRTEIYCHGQFEHQALIEWVAQTKTLGDGELDDRHYHYEGEDAARHMMTVASGLDSLVLGEPQILGQMKSAYAVSKEKGFLGSNLHDAFHRVFSVAKRVRSETAIGENPVSVAYAAVSLAQQIFSDLKQDTALLVGAGETIELVARHLLEQGINRIIVANRTLENATKLASSLGAEAILLAEIPEYLHRADIVISSTASQLPILGKGAVEQALKARKHKPMFMVDIAVPRDIEPQVSELADVFLYTVDDLREVIDENKRSREQAAQIAHEIIDEGVKKYEREQRALNSVDTIKQFRSQIDGLREAEVTKALKSLESGADAEQVIANLARNLSNKIMHVPMSQLKTASEDGRDEIARSFRFIFNLPDEEESSSENK